MERLRVRRLLKNDSSASPSEKRAVTLAVEGPPE
jgi:hypothetical protein